MESGGEQGRPGLGRRFQPGQSGSLAAAGLSKVIEIYVKAIEATEVERRLLTLEATQSRNAP